MGIARDQIEDYYRQRLRAPESIDDPDHIADVPAASPEILDFLEQTELREKTWDVMEELSKPYRLVLI